MDVREVEFRDPFDHPRRKEVAAIRFVVTREDRRGEGLASRLMGSAHDVALRVGLPYAVLFTGVTDFYRANGYEEVGDGAMAYGIHRRWPGTDWHPIGEKW